MRATALVGVVVAVVGVVVPAEAQELAARLSLIGVAIVPETDAATPPYARTRVCLNRGYHILVGAGPPTSGARAIAEERIFGDGELGRYVERFCAREEAPEGYGNRSWPPPHCRPHMTTFVGPLHNHRWIPFEVEHDVCYRLEAVGRRALAAVFRLDLDLGVFGRSPR